MSLLESARNLRAAYLAAGLDLPEAAAEALAVWDAIEAAADPRRPVRLDLDGIDVGNAAERVREAALARALRDHAPAIRDSVTAHFGDLAYDAFRDHRPAMLDQLRPRFLKAAQVVCDTLAVVDPDTIGDPAELLAFVLTDGKAEYQRRQKLAEAVAQAQEACERLSTYAHLIAPATADPAPFIDLTDDADPSTFASAKDAWGTYPRWPRLYAVPGVVPAVHDFEQADEIREQAAALTAKAAADHYPDVDRQGDAWITRALLPLE